MDESDWEVGQEILISTSTFAPEQAEKFIIKAVDDKGKRFVVVTNSTVSKKLSEVLYFQRLIIFFSGGYDFLWKCNLAI